MSQLRVITVSRSDLARILVVVAMVPLVGACGQSRMVDTNARMRSHSQAGQYQRALSTLQTRRGSAFKQQDTVVYWMNEGMLLHLLGRHQESIAALNRAERRSKQLFTRSASKQVEAAFTSDAALDYQGEDHEKVLVNVVKALGFLALNQPEGALVEARKINRKLEYFNTVYGPHRNAYSEDAFAHWLMGMLYELEGSHDDARIAFTQARRVYEQQFNRRYDMNTPRFIIEDLARAAIRTGEAELLATLRTESGNPTLGSSADLAASHGEIVLLHLNGDGPDKTDIKIGCRFRDHVPLGCDARPGGDYLLGRSLPESSTGYSTAHVAFPRVVTRPPTFDRITLRAGSFRADSELVLPIDRIAHETQRDKLPRIFQRAVIRAIAKAGSQKTAQKASDKLASKGRVGTLLGLILNTGVKTANNLTEEADKRAWTTLPARIEVARMYLPAGTHDLSLTLPNGKTRTMSGVRLAAGQRLFITHRTL